MTAPAGTHPGGGSLEHRGLLYTDRAHLVDVTVPMICDALAADREVLVVVDRATAREVTHGLLATPGHPPATDLRFPPVTAIGEHGSSTFTRTLRDWARTGARPLVLTLFAPGSDSGIDPSLTDLPITLVCACPDDADLPVLGAFHREHDVLVGVPDEPTVTPGPAVCTGVAGTADLAEVRREVRRLALSAGFRGTELDRAVLAVHEAAVLGYRMSGDDTDPDGATGCRLEARADESRMTVDVIVPAAGSGGGGALRLAGTDGAPSGEEILEVIRRFCHTVTVHDQAGARSIRVQARRGG